VHHIIITSRYTQTFSRNAANTTETLPVVEACGSRATMAFSQTPETDHSSGTTTLAVKGWIDSKLSSNPDSGISALLSFLEKKADRKILSHRLAGRTVLLITIHANDSSRFFHLNGFTFAGAVLKVENSRPPRNQANGAVQPPTGPRSQQNGTFQSSRPLAKTPTSEVEKVMIAVIHKRYNAAEKYLTLEALATDPDFVATGLSQESAEKVFKALFTICETKVFETPSKRREMVKSISLSSNSLTTVKDILSLSSAFPDLQNLDLSNNRFEDTGALRYWRNQFRNLEHLILSGNPVDLKPETKATILKWYPNLKFYNNEPVRNGPMLGFSTPTQPLAPQGSLPTSSHPEFPPGSTFGVPQPGKSEETLTKELMGLQFSFETKLKMQFVEQCLSANGWNWDAAVANFKAMQVAGSIPAEAYIPGV